MVRSPAVVVLAIRPERPIEMAPTEDQRPVEALSPDRLDHPFRVGVGVRSLDRVRIIRIPPRGAPCRTGR